MMTARVKKLRDQSLKAVPSISGERARLITEFYKSPEAGRVPPAVAHALAFKHILANKTVVFNPGELIVGERGPAPKATPTYPEVTCHSVQDLRILDSRPKTSFKCDARTIALYEKEIIPFWRGRSIRDRMMEELPAEWKAAYEAGAFTEFMEQRAPGHTVLDDKIYHRGMLDFIADIDAAGARLDFLNDPAALDRRQELQAMRIAAEGLILFARRHAEKARQLAAKEKSPERKKELLAIAVACDWVPARAPRNFQEALQAYWFVHLGVITEYNTWDSFNPGRLDQHLWPFYKAGLANGTLTRESAAELLQCFWVKFNNQPAPPKVGVTAEESGTYTDFALINVGGLRADGSDAVNDLSFLILDVIEEMRLLQPSSMVQISAKGPDAFLWRALKIVKTGFGQPSIFNTDAIVQELVRQGKTFPDARDGGASGCVEAGAFGKENYTLTGYFNIPKVFELALHDGFDPRTKRQLGPKTGDPVQFRSYEELFAAFTTQLRHLLDLKIAGNAIIERLYATVLPAPFLSILISDCVANGRDYHAGGARYNSNYIQGVGLGSITDILAAVKTHVYERKTVPMKKLLEALAANFAGREDLRQTLLLKSPKWGNDDDAADDIAKSVFEAYFAAIDGRPTVRGGKYRINLLPTTVHVYFGKVTGATPDGRKAGETLSEGISPVQGSDRRGPTAVLKSAAKIDHVRTGGTLLNQKFTPQILADEEGLRAVGHLVRTYFKMDGHHVQFNVVTADTLRDAQRHPDKYRDLIVRVAGYSDYFLDCSVDLQNEIISRTEHMGF
jgi:trans-4-hydroxy-L-proline dehydratase